MRVYLIKYSNFLDYWKNKLTPTTLNIFISQIQSRRNVNTLNWIFILK